MSTGDSTAFNVVIEHEIYHTVTFHGSQALVAGDVVRFIKCPVGSCNGAAAADSSGYGGALDPGASTAITLPGSHISDGIPDGMLPLPRPVTSAAPHRRELHLPQPRDDHSHS